MKTSNILITVAALVFLTTLVAYDFRLKDQYTSLKKLGLDNYRKLNRFNDYDQFKIKRFTELDLQSANTLNVKIEYGEKEAVWVRKHIKDRVSVSQNGEILSIDLNRLKDTLEQDWGDIVIISRDIRKVRTTALKLSKTNERYFEDFKIVIEGFKQDSLNIIAGASTRISLHKNKLKSLNSIIGDDSGDGKLTIESDNDVAAVKINVKGKSTAELLDNEIKYIEHQIADSAIVSFRGRALKDL